MSDADPEPITADEPLGGDTDATFVVADSEEYNQSRRLKAIHRARDDVREAHKQLTHGRRKMREHTQSRNQLADAVAFFVTELQPLMDELGWEADLDDEFPYDSVRDFAYLGSILPPGERDRDYVPEQWSMTVFREASKFLRETGLGLDFEDSDDEWEV